jgi:DNA polymerase (family 10)
MLWRETGAAAHFDKVQEVAAKKGKGYDLQSPNGFVKVASIKKGARTNNLSEEGLYKGLGMQFVAPELREDSGEIEAALKGTLPQDLVTVSDIQGMVHCHTNYSDGKDTIHEMALAAEAMGMKYLTITDHSPTAFYAGGVTVDRLKRQWEEIEEVQQTVNIRILKGTESDIVADGSLDYPDRILEQFDVIVASIHSRYKMDSEKMTRRLISAMRHPVFKIWGHALGRLIQRRPPFDCDIERVLDAIAESRAAIEINGDPFRLDLEPGLVRAARKRRLKFVISVDAHSTAALKNLKYGVGIARRGWVRKSEVLNALDTKRFMKAVRPAAG